MSADLHTEDRQFGLMLAAMILGIIAGALLREFAPDYVISFIDKNIITSIRSMFLNALNMMIAPVVFFSIIAGITSMADASDISRIGGKLILLYMCTTVIAAVLGMIVGVIPKVIELGGFSHGSSCCRSGFSGG